MLGPGILHSSAPSPYCPVPTPCSPYQPLDPRTLPYPVVPLSLPPASSPTPSAYPQRAPPGRAGDRRCRHCFGSVAAGTRGAAATGAAGGPPGCSSSGPVGSPAWRELLGEKPRRGGNGLGGAAPVYSPRKTKAPRMLRPHFQAIHPHLWFPGPQAARLKLPGFPGIQRGGRDALGRSVLSHRARPLTFLPLNDSGHQQPQKCQQDEDQEDGDQEVKALVFH